jgi:hypothetical protein
VSCAAGRRCRDYDIAKPRSSRRLFCAVLCAPLFAQTTQTTPKRSERLQQSEVKQQQLQRTTQRVGEQLSGIITEFERNGIAGEDVNVLRAIRMVLGRLGDKEMAQVITLLQQAQQGPDDNTARKTVTEAYSGQKTIITQLKQLLLEYQRQQALLRDVDHVARTRAPAISEHARRRVAGAADGAEAVREFRRGREALLAAAGDR